MTLPDDHRTPLSAPDFTRLNHRLDADRNPDADALRIEITDEINRQIAELQALLARLENRQHEGEAEEALEMLHHQIRGLPGQADASQAAASTTRILVTSQIGTHFAEMTDAAIARLRSVHDATAAAFRAYEAQSYQRIRELAAENGLDLTGYDTLRTGLLDERDAAQAEGDRVGVAGADALLADANAGMLETAGGSGKEVERARREAEAARERYLHEIAMRAREHAQAHGLSGADAARYIQQAVDAADRALTARIEENRERLGLDAGSGETAELGRHRAREESSTSALLAERTHPVGEPGASPDPQLLADQAAQMAALAGAEATSPSMPPFPVADSDGPPSDLPPFPVAPDEPSAETGRS